MYSFLNTYFINYRNIEMILSDFNIILYVTGSDILSLVKVQRWRLKTWDESDVITFACNVNWVSAHWLNSFKASPEEKSMMESKKISNDQELIQSDPTSCPQNPKGNN